MALVLLPEMGIVCSSSRGGVGDSVAVGGRHLVVEKVVVLVLIG